MYMFHANNGKTLNYTGNPLPGYNVPLQETNGRLCNHGLHASPLPSQAVRYHSGPFLDLVVIRGRNSDIGSDKVSATERTRLATIDMREVAIFVSQQAVLESYEYDGITVREMDHIVEFVMNPTAENAKAFRAATFKHSPYSWHWSTPRARAIALADKVLGGDYVSTIPDNRKLFDDECVLRFQKMGHNIRIIG